MDAEEMAAWCMWWAATLLVAASASSAYACTWYLDTKGDQFYRHALAEGYARVHMYQESFAVLAGLSAEDLGP